MGYSPNSKRCFGVVAAGLLLGACSMVQRCVCGAPSENWQEVLAYVGSNLSEDTPADGRDFAALRREQQRVRELLDSLLPSKIVSERGSVARLRPWCVAAAQVGNGLRVIVVEAAANNMPTGSDEVFVHLFGDAGGYISSCRFRTGSKVCISGASVSSVNSHRFPIIAFHCDQRMRRQLYAVYKDDVVLVRLEGDSSTLVANNYFDTYRTSGPTPPLRSASEWEDALRSTEPAEVLRTLTWLAGKHDPDPSKPTLASRVLARDGVGAVLSGLATSPDPWIQEAAKAVVTQRR